MNGAHGAIYARALGSLVILGLGLSLPSQRPLASQHGVFARLSVTDRQIADSILQSTLEQWRSGEPHFWRNETTGSSGSVMAMRSFRIKTGHFCREYRETTVADRKLASRDLTACRSDDGVWITIEK